MAAAVSNLALNFSPVNRFGIVGVREYVGCVYDYFRFYLFYSRKGFEFDRNMKFDSKSLLLPFSFPLVPIVASDRGAVYIPVSLVCSALR